MITTPSQQTRTQTTMPLLALCLGYFMTILDVTIVNVALVDIKQHLSATVTGRLLVLALGVAWVFMSEPKRRQPKCENSVTFGAGA
jgi:MFS transporter, DHA2 family, methylenomycin A resistance protein